MKVKEFKLEADCQNGISSVKEWEFIEEDSVTDAFYYLDFESIRDILSEDFEGKYYFLVHEETYRDLFDYYNIEEIKL